MGVMDKLIEQYQENAKHNNDLRHFTVPRCDVIDLAKEIAESVSNDRIADQLRFLIAAQDIDGIERALNGSAFMGVTLTFDGAKPSQPALHTPQGAVASYLHHSGLEITRFGSGRVALRFAGTWLASFTHEEWDEMKRGVENV